MTSTTTPKNALLNIIRIKISMISKVERRYIDRSEEHVLAYAEALADANIITDDERDELYEQARQAAQSRIRHFQGGNPKAAQAADIEVQSTLDRQT